jgi:EAL domain-containing protein (putative c-di-GMP-specific phosphodiesterase class I)
MRSGEWAQSRGPDRRGHRDLPDAGHECDGARLEAVKDLGVSIAVDDFGTGYSSLAYLQQFPVDCIKIDKSFTSAMVGSPESAALIRTFVQLGTDLGLVTLAEGVETTEQMDLLRADHVDEAQGYLFARPLEPEISNPGSSRKCSWPDGLSEPKVERPCSDR